MRFLRPIRNLLGNYQLKSGIYHYDRGESQQAIDYLTRALQAPDSTDPDRRMALYYLTQAYIGLAEKCEDADEMDKAVEAYHQALAMTPDYPDLHFRLGTLCARLGLIRDAVESFRRAVELNPGYLEARAQMAMLLLRDRQTTQAAREFAEVRDLALQAIDQPYGNGAACLERGEFDQAEEWMRSAFLRRPESFEFHFRRGLRSLREGKTEAAVEALRQASAFRADFADVYNFLGVALGEQEEWGQAIEAFRRAIEINSGYLVARLNLAFALAEGGRDSEATDELRAVLQAEPDNQPARAKLEELAAPRRERAARPAGETRA
jgi:tetratricopeptide (TPR) repeat protein